MEGLLSYFPRLRDEIEVRKVQFDRPRQEVVRVLGEENQGCPVLVLADPSRAAEFGLSVKEVNGRSIIDDEKAILAYLSRAYGVSRPSHD
ncbi:DUF3088 domain-containing protein [Pseudodesulfovibrio sp.]|nr:DUF3088 domain-containing protein [Pseudodesulfovibrio sp.]